MKKTAKIFCFLILLSLLFSARAAADGSSDREYLITQDGEKYILHEYYTGAPSPVKESASLSELFEELNGGLFTLDNVRTDEGLEFPEGEFRLNGKLSVGGSGLITVPDGTSLHFDKFTVAFDEDSESYIRIKGGAVSMTDSYVFGALGGAFLMDYSTESRLSLVSCGIYSASTAAAVKIKQGSFVISGGSIENTMSTAIENDGVLYMSSSPDVIGVGWDIVTEKPITLSYGNETYNGGGLRIKYDAEFLDGTMTEILYSSSEAITENVLLCDKHGKEYPLTYFEVYNGYSEKSFSGVYLPYTVKFYDNTELLAEKKYLRGERLQAPEFQKKDGYEFVGWHTPDNPKESYVFDVPVSGNLSLCAGYKLIAPTVSASSLGFIYDGESRPLCLDDVSHPLDGAGGFYTYKWYKDGVQVSESSSINITRVSDGGNYSCEVTFNYSSDTSSVTVENITVAVEKQVIKLPEVAPGYYTGELLLPEIADSEKYTFNTDGGVDVGEYTVVFTLSDAENCRWDVADGAVAERCFEVLRAENLWIKELTVFDVYYGADLAPAAKSKFGSVTYLYSSTEFGSYTQTPPRDVGRYFIKAVVTDSVNYSGIISTAVPFSIIEEAVIGLSVASEAITAVYKAFDKFSPVSLALTVKYNSGREDTVQAEKIAVSYQNGDAFLFGDNAVILSYGGCSLSYPVTVERADYDISNLLFNDIIAVYDGKYHTAVVEADPIVGKDGIVLAYKVNGGGSDVGEYLVTVSFDTDSRNYNIPDDKTVTVKVLPLTVNVEWQGQSFVYDATAKAPAAYYTDVFGVRRRLSVTGAAVNAGSDYVATVTSLEKNYAFQNKEQPFSIEKADYDFSGISWNADSFIYSGNENSVYVIGLPEGVAVVGYTDGRATNAGEYIATAVLSYDERNYNKPPSLSHIWTVEKARYDMSGVSFTDSEYIYDGNIHYPTLDGDMPVGADGISVSVIYSCGATHVSEGRVEVSAIFVSESDNYFAPDEMMAYVEIKPRAITAYWSIGDYVYSGRPQGPSAIAAECALTVSGAETNAGSYTARAEATNSDFYVENSTVAFSIAKAQNYWTTPLRIDNIFASGTPAPIAAAFFGTAEFEFFTDMDCTDRASLPLSAGVFYVRAEIDESENFLPLLSEAVCFEVYAVVPVGINAEILREELKAFYSLARGDFVCRLLYNDGSSEELNFGLVSVLYENTDSLRVADRKITLVYGDFSTELPVSVSKADYDTSAVRWIYTESVYDGVAKSPVLTGLPSGITVEGYIGGNRINAGEYTVSASLSYDTENYNTPSIPECRFIIRKAVVASPIIPPAEYRAEIIVPQVDGEIYTIVSMPEIRNAGSYILSVALADGDNYCFTNGADFCEVVFAVTPRPVSVLVSDLDVYLWDKPAKAEYSIPSGSLFDGDCIGVIQRIEGDTVYLYSDNPNYVLEGAVSRLNRLSVPRPEVMRVIAISFVLLLFLILLVVVLLLNRKRIAVVLARLREHEAGEEKKSPQPQLPRAVYAPVDKDTASCYETAPEDDSLSIDGAEEESDIDISEGGDTESAHDSTDASVEQMISETVSVFEEGYSTTVDMEKADELITDSLAKNLMKKGREAVYTSGNSKSIINVDTLSQNFAPGERVDVNVLKNKSLVPYDTAYIKVLARGIIDKPLRVCANDFSLSAVKMIALTGGEAVKVITVKEKHAKRE